MGRLGNEAPACLRREEQKQTPSKDSRQMQVTHSKKYRQTTTMCEDLRGEPVIEQQQPAHKQGVHLSVLEGEHCRGTASAGERQKEKRSKADSESWCESTAQQQTKSNTTRTTPFSGQQRPHPHKNKVLGATKLFFFFTKFKYLYYQVSKVKKKILVFLSRVKTQPFEPYDVTVHLLPDIQSLE